MYFLRRLRLGRSLFLTITAIMAVCSGLAVGIMSYSASVHDKEVAIKSLRERAAQVVELLAGQAGGAIKFGKADVNQALFTHLIKTSHLQVTGALAVGIDGTLVGSTTIPGVSTERMQSLALAAINTGQEQSSAEGIVVAAPSVFGKDNAIVGAVAMEWTSDHVMEQRQAAMFRSNVISGAVFFGTLILASLIFRAWISQPLTRAANAMTKLGEGVFDMHLPKTRRKDEIGIIWGALRTYRDALETGAAAKAESDFKSAAFQGSSAPMMITDETLIIRYVNPGMHGLLNTLATEMSRAIGDFDPEHIVGRKIDDILTNAASVRELLSKPDRFPFSSNIVIGDVRLELTYSAVLGDGDVHKGIVIEWNDVTQDWFNKAILDAIDRDQVKAEFDLKGKCLSVNDRFALLTSEPAAALAGRKVSSLLAVESESNADIMDVMRSAQESGAEFGKFRLTASNGETAILDGGFTCVKDQDDAPVRLVLISQDITEADRSLKAVQLERRSMMRDQKTVVEAIQVGLKRLSHGDLTVRIDEPFGEAHEGLRHDFNGTVESLAQAVKEVVDSAESIRNEAVEISDQHDCRHIVAKNREHCLDARGNRGCARSAHPVRESRSRGSPESR